MPKVTGLGHVGLFVKDMPMMVDFYSNFLGLTVTDRGMNDRIVFFSAHPEDEHHELALVRSDDRKSDTQQLSFKAASLADLRDFYKKVVEQNLEIDHVVNHGIAFGCYFKDPENNVVEVYWSTGKDYPQPHADKLDLSMSEAELLDILENMPPKEGSGPRFYGEDAGKRLLTTHAN
jgi:catechol-2,3-dioxygenase